MNKSRRTVLIVLLLMGYAGLLVPALQAVSVVTGKFTAYAMDTPTSRTIDTGLTHVRVLRIYVYEPKRPAEVAHTTDQIQADRPGAFLNHTKWDTGLSISGGMFTLNHALFKKPGVTYYWEALGD